MRSVRGTVVFASIATLVMLVGVGVASGRPDTVASPPPYRYVFNSEDGTSKAASLGWNLIDVGTKSAADSLPRGARALVWLGDYDNERCGWDMSDGELTRTVRGMAGDPKVAGYFFSDEPDPFACPRAPAEHRARSRLIRSLDPRAFTVMVMDSNSDRASLKQMPWWIGAATYVGLNPYPCYQGKPCNYAWIDTLIRKADRLGFRYWGAVQAFGDSTWRVPKPAELERMLSRWSRSRWSGYMTFSWTWDGNVLTSRPELVDVLMSFNRRVPSSVS